MPSCLHTTCIAVWYQLAHSIKLKDLVRNYVVTEINLYPLHNHQLAEQGRATGECLMNVGLALTNSTELTSAVIEIKAK